MQPATSISPNTEDDIDRKALRALRTRFLRLNAERLDALRARLSHDHRIFIDALPVLLHSNHAALPGFVDFDMPCGIDKYTPDRAAINAVRKIALSFTQERFVERRAQILGVYIAACASKVDAGALELSVCAARSSHAQLNLKLSRIVRFADSQGIRLSTVLLDPAEEQAQRSTLPTPWLSRDEFYRSAILLAGRYPIWWLVPPELDDQHDAYCARLKAQRFIGRDESLDLGPAQRIPRSECLIAGVDLLGAALDAPYAHLHMLMLLERYASDPTAITLARLYKSRIWRNEADIDAALLAYESIAAYLVRRNEPERLELARHCLLASTVDSPQLREACATWRWSEAQLRHARGDRELTITELERENSRVNAELQRAHAALTHLADESPGQVQQLQLRAHLGELGDRIAQLTEQPAGTITRVNPALLPKRIAGMVSVEPHNGGWRLHEGASTVFAAPRLAALMAWAHLHGLGIDNLRIGDADLRQSCTRVLELLVRHATNVTAEPAKLLIINAEESPLSTLKAHGDAIVSEWDDSLDFSGFHTSLVAGIDTLDVRGDGIAAHSYIGDDGLIEVLLGLLVEPAANLHLGCVGGERRHAIEERIGALATELSESFARDQHVGRFVFTLAEGFVIIERSGDGIRARRCADEAQLFEAVAIPVHDKTLRVDPRNARLNALLQLCKIGSGERDTVLVHEQRAIVRVFLLTRSGAIHVFDPPQRSAQEIAESLLAFFTHLARLPIQHRGGSVRVPNIQIARGADNAPVAVVASHGDLARYPGYATIVAPDVLRRGLVATLTEKFAVERASARRLASG